MTEEELNTLAVECAARGALLMDKKLRGWHTRINAERLAIESSCHCVLGQAYKSFTAGLLHVFGTAYPFGLMCDYGFTHNLEEVEVDERPLYVGLLNEAWRSEISKRFNRNVSPATEFHFAPAEAPVSIPCA